MDGPSGFSASNGSKTNPPRSSDSRLVMLNEVQSSIKFGWDLHAKFGTFSLVALQPENVIGRAARPSRARADRDFTGPVGLGPVDSDLTSIPGRVRSEAI
jgi:hypothetical protein